MNPTTPTEPTRLDDATPEWVAEALPQRRAEIDAEISKLQAQVDRLEKEADSIESIAHLLWQAGPPLEQAVRNLFSAVGFEADLAGDDASCDVVVNLGGGKRLLIKVVGTDKNITPKSTELRQVLEAVQSTDGDGDRVVLAANPYRDRPVVDREWLDPVTGDAMMILTGLGAVFVQTATLFRIWQQAGTDAEAAAAQLRQLHEAPAGFFTVEG